MGIGESLLLKAIGESTGRSLAVVKSDLKRDGDLGLVAMVPSRFYWFVLMLTISTAFEEQSENSIQAEASHSPFRVQEPERDRH